MTPDSWAAWKTNPQTADFFKYIRDFREQTGEIIAASVALGVCPDPEFAKEAALRCQIYLDLEELSFADIEKFYNPEKEGEEENGTENSGA